MHRLTQNYASINLDSAICMYRSYHGNYDTSFSLSFILVANHGSGVANNRHRCCDCPHLRLKASFTWHEKRNTKYILQSPSLHAPRPLFQRSFASLPTTYATFWFPPLNFSLFFTFPAPLQAHFTPPAFSSAPSSFPNRPSTFTYFTFFPRLRCVFLIHNYTPQSSRFFLFAYPPGLSVASHPLWFSYGRRPQPRFHPSGFPVLLFFYTIFKLRAFIHRFLKPSYGESPSFFFFHSLLRRSAERLWRKRGWRVDQKASEPAGAPWG